MLNKTAYLKLNSYQKKYLSEIKKLRPSNTLLPWKKSTIFHLDGVFGFGWTKDNFVLLINYDGYILINYFGEIIEKDYKISPYELMSNDNLEFHIPNRNEKVRIFGIYGGNGNLVTTDGWKLNIVYPSWPKSIIQLKRPKDQNNNFEIWDGVKLIELEEIEYVDLKCGFSLDEKHFLISGNNGVEVFTRLENSPASARL